MPSEPKSEKEWLTGPGVRFCILFRNEILISLSGRAEIAAMRAGPDMKTFARADLFLTLITYYTNFQLMSSNSKEMLILSDFASLDMIFYSLVQVKIF